MDLKSFILKPTRLVGLFVFILLFSAILMGLSGCENKYEELESNYYSGHYLDAIEAAAEGYFDPSIRPKVSSFLSEFGSKLFDKAFLQGDELGKDYQSEEAVLFWSRLLVATQKLDTNAAPVDSLKGFVSSAESRLKTATDRYVETHWELAQSMRAKSHYREALFHLDQILKYSNNRPEIVDFYNETKELAKQVVVIYPFYTASDSMPAQLKSLFKTLAPAHRTPASGPKAISTGTESFKSFPILQGIRVSDRFSGSLLRALDKYKSPYMTFILAGSEEKIPESVDYVIRGLVQPDEEDTESFPEREVRNATLQYTRRNYGDQEWFSSNFQYTVFKNAYRVNMVIEANVLHPTSNAILSRVNLTKRAENAHEYKSKDIVWNAPPDVKATLFPIEYDRLLDVPISLDRRDLVKQAIDTAADELAKKILAQIDKNLLYSKPTMNQTATKNSR